jgi:dihydrolipoamide dehydrogenase
MTMSNLVEVKVPDIGDFAEVPIIDLFVKVGDSIKADDAICTLESDKATMDVPAPVAGVVKEVLVQLGAKVGEGALLIKVESGASAAVNPVKKAAKTETAPAAAPVAAPVAGSHAGGADIECEMLVLGAGPGGYSAAFRSADLGMKTVIVERYATLGGVCLNVGCIPSKALLHVAAVMEEAEHANDLGVTFAAPTVDIDKLRAHKDKVVGKLTGGLAGMAKGRKVEIVRGYGTFLDPHHIEVEVTDGTGQDKTGAKKVVKFQKCIIAAGSAAMHLPFIPKDPRIVDSTGALCCASTSRKDAGHRRRHHRPRNGYGLFDPGLKSRCRRNDGWPDARPGSRRSQGLGKAERQALRQDHAEDQDGQPTPRTMACTSRF